MWEELIIHYAYTYRVFLSSISELKNPLKGDMIFKNKIQEYEYSANFTDSPLKIMFVKIIMDLTPKILNPTFTYILPYIQRVTTKINHL